MSYGIGKQAQAEKGGKIKGKGTGTSDDIKKTVPSGSFIMPKDSTDAIGEENLARLGEPTDVNLSNGEFQLTPDQVHAVGVQALDQMKDQTHEPVDQPTVGFGIGGEEKPELFFANGGAVQGFNSPTEDYATRMGLDPSAERGLGAELGIRAAGVLSDVGNAASFGILGNRFPDKQLNQAKADLAEQQARFAAHNAQKNQAPAAAPKAAAAPAAAPKAAAAPAAAPSIDQQMNDSMYGNAQPAPRQAAASNDPYQIKQQGNSFSYANPGAAAAARAQGIPELQSTGINGGANDPAGVANLMANTRPMGASQEQIDRAIQQSLNGGQGFGIQYPDRPQRNDAQEAERRNVLNQIQAPIKGARGMTSSQRSQLAEMQTGEDSRAVQLYNTDANNATSQANNTANNSANIAQTMMREQGSNERAVLGENGQNMRFGANLDNDKSKFNREMSLTEAKEGFGIRNAARVEKLNEMYDKAETDEQRQSIMQRINRLTGAKDQSGKDRYMTVGGGQEYNGEEGVMINRPQQIFDTQTGRLLNMDGTPAGGPGATADNSQFDTSKLKDGQVYQAPSTGQYFRWDAKSGRAIPVQQ